MYCDQVKAQRFFCIECDQDESEVQDWFKDNPGAARPDGECCVVKLSGQPLRFTNRGITANWDLFEDDPLPAAEHPTMGNNNRRFFCYTAVAKHLGGRMSRFKLPDCLDGHIEELYPRNPAVPPVGFSAY
mmetsp:Transcript_8787/g.17703  ORF Transcript_8787/g.17703 Transcript_8787/m.17703 type:complete len:130 (-) Transcript_8787:196-585(-)|eukprot:CAMPEP_0119080000 /NCGR_PEP_ID=MMETSP1178-20130426/110098_1 /TAXON_ID=33656 /ORGANISM="unid sp, Strain CCMP2000" /LENGTH=129 /DNA_ID=CAMNT_0007062561 /DNA_START=35 /DNA_END=424 /DNA_ORIENTATION=+